MVLEYLKEKNFWWKDKKGLGSLSGIERKSYKHEIMENLGTNRIIAIAGIRRSGKTTLMYQVIEELLKTEDSRRILYFKLDDIIDRAGKIEDIIKVYEEETGFFIKKDKVYVFIDEIHVLEGWQRELKKYFDSKYPAKFIVSGSSKNLLYLNASESLVGRITFVNVFPLTFREFLAFKDIEAGTETGISSTFDDFKSLHNSLITEKGKIKHALKLYMDVGGFPEWFQIKDIDRWRKILYDEYFSLIIYKDIVKVFRVKNPIILENLVREVSRISTNRFTYLNTSNILDTDKETVKLYLYYLTTSMMIFILEKFTKGKKPNERSEKKVCFWEEGMRKAVGNRLPKGQEMENIISWHLVKNGMGKEPFFKPYYWRNGEEVDFIYQTKNLLLPIEVKYTNNISEKKIKGLLKFMDEFQVKKGIVVTKDILEQKQIGGKTIFFIPAWLFLLSV